MNPKSQQIANLMTEARVNTLAIFDLASEADLHVSPGHGYRPIIWHLAHIGVFESYWLLQQVQRLPSIDPLYDRIFDPIRTPRESSVDLPSRQTMQNYLARVRGEVLRYLDETDFDNDNPLTGNGYIFDLVLQHEYQHQETLAYLFQLLDPSKKQKPEIGDLHLEQPEFRPEMIRISGGTFQMGATDHLFAYDNELPAHTVNVLPFKIDRTSVTNQEFAEFVSGGGYIRQELWCEEGWSRRTRENWTAPPYWRRDGDHWIVRTMFGESPPEPYHPVTGVSWYEAEAYSRFVNKRLPTEAEWEMAAAWDPGTQTRRRFAWGDIEPVSENCNFGFERWGTTPVGAIPLGASYFGALDMTGNVWEWTADTFEGYKGFKAFPYPEYSEEWFDGDHSVLKGGSWATRAPLLRTSFRNFFRRHFRLAFSGIRCAADL